MLSRRPASWFRLLPLALVIPGCDGGQTSVPPTPLPTAGNTVRLTCALGTSDCAAVMQGQTLTFTASADAGGTANRSATLVFGDDTPPLDLGGLAAPATVSHEYMRLGTFAARLDVSAAGVTRSSIVSIRVDSFVTASLAATNLGALNVEAIADVQGAAVARYEWLFEPDIPPVVTDQPRALFTYPSPGYKAVELRVVLVDGRVIRASSHVIVGREHEP